MSVTVPQVRPVPRQNFSRDEELRRSRGGVNTISIASTEQRGFERQGGYSLESVLEMMRVFGEENRRTTEIKWALEQAEKRPLDRS